jgi:hypothetical protein
MDGGLTVWHNRRDTLLRIVEGEPPKQQGEKPADAAPAAPAAPAVGEIPYCSVYIPIGISPGMLRRHNITVEYRLEPPHYGETPEERVDREQDEAAERWMRVGLNVDNKLGRISRLTPSSIAHLRDPYSGLVGVRRLRPYLEMARVFQEQPEQHQPAYYEAVLHFIPKGARLQYRIKVYEQSRKPIVVPAEEDEVHQGWYSVYVVMPTFTVQDIMWCAPRDASVPDVNVVYWQRDAKHPDNLLHFRFDFVEMKRLLNDFRLGFAGGQPAGAPNRLAFAWLFDGMDPGAQFADAPISKTWHLKYLPVVHAQLDYVTLTLPLAFAQQRGDVVWRGATIGTWNGDTLQQAVPKTFNPIRLMFIHYANQSLNDLFESPNRSYSPPRSYIETTMCDELGTYSSRPTSNETGVGDGYGFVLDAHEETGLPAVWAMNGGFISMLAQDTPEAVESMKRQIKAGLLEPSIGGLGGHRMIYFSGETNYRSIHEGIEILENILDGTGRIFHPNSRGYSDTPNLDGQLLRPTITRPIELKAEQNKRVFTSDPIADPEQRPPIQFVVIDDWVFEKYPRVQRPGGNEDFWQGNEHAYTWRQRCSAHSHDEGHHCQDTCPSWYWLFIDQDLKDGLLGASDEEWRAGKLSLNLRKRFFYGVSHPSKVEKPVFVYSDDADKAAGNGWFDGDYNGNERDNLAIFTAALEWIAAHPWLQAVTAADLHPDRECVGTLRVRCAIDPSIHQEVGWSDGYRGEDGFDQWSIDQMYHRPPGVPYGFEYARWYHTWRNTRSDWLGLPFGTIGDEIERAVMRPESDRTPNRLDRLAQLAFLLAIHEAHWSKTPLEPFTPKDHYQNLRCGANNLPAYHRPEVLEPENFVLALTLQMRNAHVYRCAARWADWVPEAGRGPGRARAVPKGEILKPGAPFWDDLVKMRQSTCVQLGQLAGGVPALQWDLDVTNNVVLFNERLLVVMDSNGGRITHIFAIGADGHPVTVSGTFKAYQFLGDDRLYGGTLPSNGSVLQNTVFVPNHRYVASDIGQSMALFGARHNPKNRLKTEPCGDKNLRVDTGPFGAEDWLFPDNFNCYRPGATGRQPASVTWEYPGLAWDVNPTDWGSKITDNSAFHTLLSSYREYVQKALNDPTVLPEAYGQRQPAGPPFSKKIALEGATITVTYAGNFEQGHTVANELSLDLLRMVMHGDRQTASRPGGYGPTDPIEVSSRHGDVRVKVQPAANCKFTRDTLKGDKNRRLHRAFSDCLEIESTDAHGFSYTITLL